MAGFGDSDLEIELHENTLRVTGSRNDADESRTFLHHGIAGCSFERRFQLADPVKVNGASLTNGLLNIDLRREIPEAKKPRRIDVNANGAKVETLKQPHAA